MSFVFNHQATQFDLVNALRLAEASQLAYKNEQQIDDLVSKEWGFALCTFFDVMDTQALKIAPIILLEEISPSNFGRKTLQAHISVEDAQYMKRGDHVSLGFEDHKSTEARFAGVIASVDPSVDPATR